MSVSEIELDVIMDAPNVERAERGRKSEKYHSAVCLTDAISTVDPDINACLSGECGLGLQEVAHSVMMENIYR